jgi:hypothetical protein
MDPDNGTAVGGRSAAGRCQLINIQRFPAFFAQLKSDAATDDAGTDDDGIV